MRFLYFFWLFILGVQILWSQNDTVVLEEANLSSNLAIKELKTQHTWLISDSILKKNSASLTQLLNYNTPIYFKENGAGMVASPSFRGTTASQTVVLWNGININSQTTGQTDFNTVNVQGFDQIKVKAGGGNVAENNNAIGGSIELINDLPFKRGFSNEIQLKYGSFETFTGNFKSSYSNENLSFNLGYSRHQSANDFDFPKGYLNQKNTNGQFYNNNINLGAAYKINPKNTLKFYGNLFQAKRHLSVISPYATRQKYEDYNSRSLVEWQSRFGRLESQLKLAYLNEEYRFFANINKEYFDKGTVNSWIAKYDLNYTINEKLRTKIFFEFTQNHGQLANEASSKTRNLGALGFNLQHQILERFSYQWSVRQEFNQENGQPLLYSLGGIFDVNSFYRLRFNAAKNFRIPTYNDLYWPGVGNRNLKPETSYQIELGQELHHPTMNFSVTAFYNKVNDLIRWAPNINPLGGVLWQPENIHDVKIYGIESMLTAKKKIGQHDWALSATYAYTISENQTNQKQLIYVPYHKATTSLAYYWKNFSAYTQWLLNGKVFTTTNNEPSKELNSFLLGNFGLGYDFGKENTYQIGFEIMNLMDRAYESVENRPMPGRSFHLNINFKI